MFASAKEGLVGVFEEVGCLFILKDRKGEQRCVCVNGLGGKEE